MKTQSKSATFRGNVYTPDIITRFGYDFAVDEWIWAKVPCVLLYKDGIMDIYPVEDYTAYELAMLRRDSRYKSPWIPIGYGMFEEMQTLMYRLASEGPSEIGARSTK